VDQCNNGNKKVIVIDIYRQNILNIAEDILL